MELIKDYWVLILALVSIVAAGFKQYYGHLRFKEVTSNNFKLQKIQLDKQEKKILATEETMQNHIITNSQREAVLETKILLQVERQEKMIMEKLLQQEIRNNTSNTNLDKTLNTVMGSIDLMKQAFDTQTRETNRVVNKLENLERERLNDLKDRVKNG